MKPISVRIFLEPGISTDKDDTTLPYSVTIISPGCSNNAAGGLSGDVINYPDDNIALGVNHRDVAGILLNMVSNPKLTHSQMH